jgi:superfamily II DNA helicase RecQ
MHSYADLRIHEYFFAHDYPPVENLAAIAQRLRRVPQAKEALRNSLSMDPEVFNTALEKLAIHGGAAIDFAENVTAEGRDWQRSYTTQLEQKRVQLGLMRRYAEAYECRMQALVRYFGDFADSKRVCGQCDFCAPKQCIAQRFRTITKAEQQAVRQLVDLLRHGKGQSTGKLHKLLFPSGAMSRDDFEDLVGAMAGAGLVLVEDASFEKGDQIISYRKVTLTPEGYKLSEHTPVEILLAEGAGESEPVKPRRRKSAATKEKQAESVTFSSEDAALEEKLRAWRLAEARKLGRPAFFVFSDRTLRAIVLARPTTPADLLAVEGIGPAKAEKFGQDLLRICRSSSHAQGRS